MCGKTKNGTPQIDFNILGFSSLENVQLVFCVGAILMYFLTVFGNLVIITLVCLVSQLQKPMYFFLCILSIQDIIYVSAILPKFMSITITGDKTISYLGCMIQVFLFSFCVIAEFFLLTSMAYDRYVAICIPLHYTVIMSKKICAVLASASLIVAILNSILFSSVISNYSFCKSQDINHFFCDIKTVMKLSCSDTTNLMKIIVGEGILFGFIPVALIITSYVYIISTILKIRTSTGRLKTFSSCSSHLTVVIIFCGTALSLYLKPETENSQEQDKLISLLYVAVVPMLNPLVYSLRNKQVAQAFKKVTGKIFV
ncbi:olfactory receptor 10J5-like [Bombina bombina]|uniref:olfactory receptor 10J5-like n=1 Tax=Bombina bombina TaxID=8345 RepID=UPI00235B1658|nr:olfactory receptor 10J5-like [Bombina bombina]